MSVGRDNRAVCIGVGIFLMSRCRDYFPCLGISGYTKVGPIYISMRHQIILLPIPLFHPLCCPWHLYISLSSHETNCSPLFWMSSFPTKRKFIGKPLFHLMHWVELFYSQGLHLCYKKINITCREHLVNHFLIETALFLSFFGAERLLQSSVDMRNMLKVGHGVGYLGSSITCGGEW